MLHYKTTTNLKSTACKSPIAKIKLPINDTKKTSHIEIGTSQLTSNRHTAKERNDMNNPASESHDAKKTSHICKGTSHFNSKTYTENNKQLF